MDTCPHPRPSAYLHPGADMPAVGAFGDDAGDAGLRPYQSRTGRPIHLRVLALAEPHTGHGACGGTKATAGRAWAKGHDFPPARSKGPECGPEPREGEPFPSTAHRSSVIQVTGMQEKRLQEKAQQISTSVNAACVNL